MKDLRKEAEAALLALFLSYSYDAKQAEWMASNAIDSAIDSANND